MRPLRQHLRISLTTSAFLITSFVLFLLVGLSLTIIKPIYIFELKFERQPGQPVTSVANILRFGVWGVCAMSELNTRRCFGPQIGYTIPDEILVLTGFPELVEGLADGVTALLVLHLVSAGFAFIGAFTSLFLESRAMCITSLIITVLNIIIALIVFAADLALAIIGRQRVGPLTDFNYTANWGPAVWMVLAAVILSFVGMVLMSVVVCGCCGVGRKHRHHHRHEERKA